MSAWLGPRLLLLDRIRWFSGLNFRVQIPKDLQHRSERTNALITNFPPMFLLLFYESNLSSMTRLPGFFSSPFGVKPKDDKVVLRTSQSEDCEAVWSRND